MLPDICDGTLDTAFGDAIAEIESILVNENSTKGELERAKDLAESVNQHDKDNPDCDTGSGSGSDESSKSGTVSKDDTLEGKKDKNK